MFVSENIKKTIFISDFHNSLWFRFPNADCTYFNWLQTAYRFCSIQATSLDSISKFNARFNRNLACSILLSFCASLAYTVATFTNILLNSTGSFIRSVARKILSASRELSLKRSCSLRSSAWFIWSWQYWHWTKHKK